MTLNLAERSHFFRQWIRAPLVTASIIPSGQALAVNMTRSIVVDGSPVVELGAGSGAITRQLLHHGVAEKDLVLVECNRYFADRLRQQFPRATIIRNSAEMLDQQNFEIDPGFVVSSLPLLSMPNELVTAILRAAFVKLRPGGCFIQFTYAPRCPVNHYIRKHLGLSAVLDMVVWRNVPPARVYHLKRFGE
ncbi:MAG: SAM-dependent methyltransferase [marine bacterium B5-7]|nr:MAG: SAM-dependent methyltransferase [marine bacterium B5-7]